MMPESLGLTMAPWFGEAVAMAMVVILGHAAATWLRDVERRIHARTARSYPLPSHLRERLAAVARATARRWR